MTFVIGDKALPAVLTTGPYPTRPLPRSRPALPTYASRPAFCESVPAGTGTRDPENFDSIDAGPPMEDCAWTFAGLRSGALDYDEFMAFVIEENHLPATLRTGPISEEAFAEHRPESAPEAFENLEFIEAGPPLQGFMLDLRPVWDPIGF